MKEKFYIIAERLNPQLGTYLSDAFVGTKKVNMTSISVRYDHLGLKCSLKFSLYANNPDKMHYDKCGNGCAYGSMAYYGFDTFEDAAAYLSKHWSKHYRYESCLAKLKA